MSRDIDKILKDQSAYYRQRAREYDEWFYREGRYDRGKENNDAWFSEIASVKQQVIDKGHLSDVLEIAAGTGLWTSVLRLQANSVHALDSSPEALQINTAKNGDSNVTYEVGDVFNWSPQRQYDFVFFSFWLSHVPEEKFEAFWELVKRALKPDGQWFFIDSKPDDFSGATDYKFNSDSQYMKRKLNDGSEFEIVKRFYEANQLAESLGKMGWRTDLSNTPRFFIYGSGKRKAP